MLKGRIIKNISDIYTVNSDNKLYECKARGKFRHTKMVPLVGDIVEFLEDEKYIINILDRRNELERPSISNIDVALIVTSLKKPDISYTLLEKEISSVVIAGVEPVICFTKLDLISDSEEAQLHKIVGYYESIGIKVFLNNRLEEMVQYLCDKYVVLTGQTGAGKSSLINRLDKEMALKIGDISEALGRGKHTTRHTEFHLVRGIYIADTPGFSALDLSKYTNSEIRDSFVEFRSRICEYRDCMHDKEINCAVKKDVSDGVILKSRYDNYLTFIK